MTDYFVKKDYAVLVRKLVGDNTDGEEVLNVFRHWLHAVRNEICAQPGCSYSAAITPEVYNQVFARFHLHPDRPQALDFMPGDTVERFQSTEQVTENLRRILVMMDEVLTAEKEGTFVPYSLRRALLVSASYTQNCAHADNWRHYRMRREEDEHVRLKKEFPGGYRLYACMTIEQASEIGKKTVTGTCLSSIANETEDQYADRIKNYLNSMPGEDMQFMTGPDGRIEALLHLADGVPQEIRGPDNQGVRHVPAMLLQDYFLANLDEHDLRGMSQDAARHIGLLWKADEGFVPYQQVLPTMLGQRVIDLERMPITQEQLRLVCGLPFKDLKIAGCADIHLEEGMLKGGSQFICYLSTPGRADTDTASAPSGEIWTHEPAAANAYFLQLKIRRSRLRPVRILPAHGLVAVDPQ